MVFARLKQIHVSASLLLLMLVIAFGWASAGVLQLRLATRAVWLPALVWMTSVLGAHVYLSHKHKRPPFLLPFVALLSWLGLLVIARVAPNFLWRQTAWLVVGWVALCVVATLPNELRWLRRFKYTWLLLAFALLVATLGFGVNPAGTGARLWLQVFGFFLQPSELLRLFLVAFLAAFFSERLEIKDWQLRTSFQSLISSFLPSALMWFIAVALLFIQQDLGAAVLLLGTFVSMLYLATGRKRLPLIGLSVLLVAGVVGYFESARVATRIAIWLNPFGDAQNTSFQIVQSLIAVANGGVFGRGLGLGAPSFVPAVHTDFPFVAIAEELGWVGCLAVLFCFAVLVSYGFYTAKQAHTPYEKLLSCGVAVSLGLQVFVIIGGNLAVLPLTGVTLPFISYGGSSLLVCFVSMGLWLRIQSQTSNRPHAMQPTPQSNAARNLYLLLLSLLLVLACTSAYWGVVRRNELLTRNDNLRRTQQR